METAFHQGSQFSAEELGKVRERPTRPDMAELSSRGGGGGGGGGCARVLQHCLNTVNLHRYPLSSVGSVINIIASIKLASLPFRWIQ